MKWTLQREIANSKIVQSSYVWLFIVPLAAKMLNSINETINFSIFGASINISTSLPFSWQLIFYAACSFSLANIAYSVFCPDIVKAYKNFSEFEAHGKSRLQINHEIQKIVWDNSKPGVKTTYIKQLSFFFKFYNDGIERSESELDYDSTKLLDDVTNIKGKNSNAFYYVYTIADVHQPMAIKFTFCCYLIGFILFGIIAIQNIYFVYHTMH